MIGEKGVEWFASPAQVSQACLVGGCWSVPLMLRLKAVIIFKKNVRSGGESCVAPGRLYRHNEQRVAALRAWNRY